MSLTNVLGFLRNRTSTTVVTRVRNGSPSPEKAEAVEKSGRWSGRWWHRSKSRSKKAPEIRVSVASTESDDSNFSDCVSPKSHRNHSPRHQSPPSSSPRTSWADSSRPSVSTLASSKRGSTYSSVSGRSSNRCSTISTSSSRSPTRSSGISDTQSVRSSVFSLNSMTSSISSISSDEGLRPVLAENRDEWFKYWDDPENGGNGNGKMSQKQIVHALRRTFRSYEKEHIEGVVSEAWVNFGEPKFGQLKREDIMKPQFGLIDTAQACLSWSS